MGIGMIETHLKRKEEETVAAAVTAANRDSSRKELGLDKADSLIVT